MRKRVFGHMQTAKALIRLRIHVVWSGPSPSANIIIVYNGLYQWITKARMRLCACAGWSESAPFAHAWKHFFAWRGPFHALDITFVVHAKYIRRTTQKMPLYHLGPTKAQISLYIHIVWSGLSLTAHRLDGCCRIYRRTEKALTLVSNTCMWTPVIEVLEPSRYFLSSLHWVAT